MEKRFSLHSLRQELLLKDRALACCTEGLVITDNTRPDNPILYSNEGFSRITGYSHEEILGKNCRFLQGPGTDPASLREIRSALEEHRDCTVELLNYRRDGTPFWNRLSITPVRDGQNGVSHHIAIISDLTEWRETQLRLIAVNEDLSAANRQLRRDLASAARVQRAMLPSCPDLPPGMKAGWRFRPGQELAGDTIDILRLGPNRAALYLLDVSGHGVASSLLSIAVAHHLAAEISSPGASRSLSPSRMATRLHRRFRANPEASQYFTMIFGLIHPGEGLFRYVSAGHPGPVRLKAGGKTETLHAPTGFPIGLLDGEYEDVTVHLEPGDRIYLYSDGFPDALSPRGECFGMDRFLGLLSSTFGMELEAALERISEEMERWCGRDSPIQDDMTILSIEIEKDRNQSPPDYVL